METSVIILAATAEPTSWNSDMPRHLVRIGAETLMGRTLRQLGELGHEATVMTDIPEVQEVVPCWIDPENRRWIVSTILSSREAWSDRVIILPGDTVWDIYVLGFILGHNHTKLPTFYGDSKEIHAIAFLREHFGKIERALGGTERVFNRDGGWCWLSHFYRVFCGRDIYDYEMKGKWEHWRTIRTLHTPSKSCVTDFDTIEEYREWFEVRHV